MRKLISLILSASIFLQIVMPWASIVTYAQTQNSLYGFTWERGKGLDRSLDIKNAGPGSTETLVSWAVDLEASNYSLDYIIENQEILEANPDNILTRPERVKLTFKKETDRKATATIEILDMDGVAAEKDYKLFDFTSIGASQESWIDKKAKHVKIDIVEGTRYQGGRVKVGDLEIRLRWKDGKVHFQTNQIKHGYITPFTLRYGNTGAPETIHALTGVEGYAVSPIHIAIGQDGTIGNNGTITIPAREGEADEKPGSKPGIKIDFKRPKQWNNTQKKFEELTEEEAKHVVTTLELVDLTDVATARLVFDMGKGSIISGLGETVKKLSYNQKTNTYSIYLAKDDEGHENIIKWDKLGTSMMLKRVQLSLIKKEVNSEKTEALGSFSPQPETKGRHTYLGYTIRRSSMEEAFIEIAPYNGARNTEYTYIVESAPNLVNGEGDWDELVEHKYMTIGENKEKPFTIPVPFKSNYDDQYYRVTAKYNQVTMSSQVLHYQPNRDLTVPPPTPAIRSIDNIYVVPPAKLGDAPEAIGFDLTWSAPKNTLQNKLLDRLLEQGNIYYELFFHSDLESVEGSGVLSKVFKVSLDENKQVKVSNHAGTAGNTPAEVRYNPSKDIFTMENIVLKNPKQAGWEQVELVHPGNNNEYEQGTRYPEFNVSNTMPSQEVPGIYYVTMKALYETTQGAIQMGVSNKSNPKSITISPLEEVIPVPNRIESKQLADENDPAAVKQVFSWSNINLSRYIKQMLEPLNFVVGQGGKGVYEIYLHQNKEIIEADLLAIEPTATKIHVPNAYKLTPENLTTLRKGEVIRLDYKGSNDTGMNSLVLDGLDKNQVYYTSIRVRLDVEDKEGKEIEKRYSGFSKQHSFTSIVEPSEPGPGERVPPVPEKLQLIEQPNNTTAKIGWEAPDYTIQEDEAIYYEIIRVDTRTLAKEEDDRLLSIKDLMRKDSKDELAAWHTKGPFVEAYTKATGAWSKASPDQYSSKLELQDPGLSPNQMYYYYVRTVLEVDGEALYSSWVGTPVTTDPIQKPIQLKVEEKEVYPHDPKREIVVSFLAPIPTGAQIPKDYDFDIAIQGELDGEYKLDYSCTPLGSKRDQKDIPTGYTHYVYRINNLKPGKRYDIKVRIIDKLVDKVNGEHPKSLYSGRVTTRTYFDQDEQDKDNKFEEYLKYFEDQVEALRRRPYWALEDDQRSFSVKYRTSYITPEISRAKAYPLEIRQGVLDYSYYMPAKAIESANLSQTSFNITQGDISYSVRPSTITTDLEQVKVALEDISDKYIRDYYVKFHFNQRTNTRVPDLLTPEITVSVELVRLTDADIYLEDDMMIALNEAILKEQKWFIDDLEKALDRGKIKDEDLEVLVSKSLASIKANHQKDVRTIISRSTHKTFTIDKWNKNMLIMAAIPGNTIAQGYSLGWQDAVVPTFNVGGGFGIEISQKGSYGFKGKKVNMPVIPNVGGAGHLIAKYQLTDFFGLGGAIDPNSNTTKRNVLGAMARVLGAPRGADYLQYLKQRDIKGVTNLGLDQPIRKGEGTYLLMQVYEKIHNKPIGSVHIKNRNALSNIRDFNQLHQPYVLVAVDSKIITGPTRPNDLMLTKDVLQVLSNIMETTR